MGKYFKNKFFDQNQTHAKKAWALIFVFKTFYNIHYNKNDNDILLYILDKILRLMYMYIHGRMHKNKKQE